MSLPSLTPVFRSGCCDIVQPLIDEAMHYTSPAARLRSPLNEIGIDRLPETVYYSAPSETGCLAQLGEHRPYKARVAGSIPAAPTKTSKAQVKTWAFFIVCCGARIKDATARPA